MRYRILGRDAASQSPVEPYFLDAKDEEEARSLASEMGTAVDRVEAAPPKEEAIQAVAAPPTPWQVTGADAARAKRASAGPASPWSRRRWLLVCLVLILASLAGGVWIGKMLPRVAPLQAGAPTVPAGIRLEELKSAEEMFALAGQQAVAIKYSGADLEFWVEIESKGKKETMGPVGEMVNLFGDKDKPPSPDEVVEGYFIWVREETDEAGYERWKVACRRALVAAETSGGQVSTPLGEASVSQSREKRQSRSMSSSRGVRVWQGKKPNSFGSSSGSSFPTPFPSDREVCLFESHMSGYRSEEWQRFSVSTVGLLGSLLGEGPLLTATAMPPGRIDAPVEKLTIKVMCKAIKSEPPAK